MENNFQLGIEFAKELDAKDELSIYKDRFYLKEDEIYMDGNSLEHAPRCQESLSIY